MFPSFCLTFFPQQPNRIPSLPKCRSLHYAASALGRSMVRSSTRVGEVSPGALMRVCKTGRKILWVFLMPDCWASTNKPRHLVFDFHQALWRVTRLQILYKRLLESNPKYLLPSSSTSSIFSLFLPSQLSTFIPARRRSHFQSLINNL